MTVADKEGNMVSNSKQTRGMGSGMVPPKLGFMLQDRELFDLEEESPLCARKTSFSYNYTCLCD
jgi:gamma-glutamyltranspeptidase/glutathione hydrolase